jgi:hypothetical protein
VPEVAERLVGLAGALRAGGVRVGTGELESSLRALGAVDPSSPEEARLALRAVLCSRREDLAVFDAAWRLAFGSLEELGAFDLPPPVSSPALPRVAAPFSEGPQGALDREPVVRPAPYSEVELLHEKDFAHYTDAERAAARALIAQLARRGPRRRARRRRAVRHRGVRPDLGRTVRRSLHFDGEPVDRRWRDHATAPRKLVLVCDVSGSMAPYARVLLQYLQAAVASRKRVEAFAFGTRLTRLTRELAGRDPDRALERAAAAVSDWSGGTRIGAAVGALNREHGRRLGRGSVVVILSDGWDRGDPETLAAEMARLRRSAHRVVWLNPLKAAEGYEPLVRGMAAALPHTDHFLAGNSLASLVELASILEEDR